MFFYNFIKKRTPQKLMEKYDRYFGFMERVFNNIKWFFQRLFRGYSDYDMINYDQFICRKILPSLRYWIHRKDRFGYPASLSSKEEWDNILEEILWAVEEAAYGTEEDKAFAAGTDYDELKKIWDREKNGLELFGKFVQGMWD